jgi:hypothetical protein
MSYETIDTEDAPFTEEEIEAEQARILDCEPRINPKYARESAIRAVEAKYDMLSAGAGGGQ